MQQLIFFAVIIGIGWYAYRKFVADAEKLAKRSKEQVKERETGARGTLVKDPVTGEYRLRKD
jgi:membrane protein implicated in regulation of membrane protease activity